MRPFLGLVILMGGCFSIPSDEQPSHSQHHIDLLIDAGRWDAAVTQGGNNCGTQSCVGSAACLLVWENTGYSWSCATLQPTKGTDERLAAYLAQECIVFGPLCQGDRCATDGFHETCLRDDEEQPRCFQGRGTCANNNECRGRGDNGTNLECLHNPDWQGELNRELTGRCVPHGMGYGEVRQGAIGFWAEHPTEPNTSLCGLAPCDENDLAGSCGLYLADGFREVADVHDPYAVCAQVPGGHNASGRMCDWRECRTGNDCQRKYLITNSECNEDGWCVAQSRYLNSFAHGGIDESAPLGQPLCSHVCDAGSMCHMQLDGAYSCLVCGIDNDCGHPNAECMNGHCRFPCSEQGQCISDETCNEQAGHCERGDDHGGGHSGGPDPCQGFDCRNGSVCENVRVRDFDQNRDLWQPVCQQVSCQDDAQCLVPGAVCEQERDGSRCTVHDLCDENSHCSGQIDCRNFANNEKLCLNLMGGAECDGDNNCAQGTTCLFGRLCGVMKNGQTACPNNFTPYSGYCPASQRNESPCDREPRPCQDEALPNCAEVHQNLGPDQYARLACLPRNCSEEVACPMPFSCVDGGCHFFGMCNSDADCGERGTCNLGVEDQCLNLATECLTDEDCTDANCYGGFCSNGEEYPEPCQGDGRFSVQGACTG